MVVAGLASGFMVGEEGVTLDIMPLVFAMADENRAEETMFLTSFAYEEAKHVDFFHRWFQAIGVSPLEMRKMQRERAKAAGMELQDEEQPNGLFESILPRTMRRLLTDRSPEAFLEASVTYNQFIEGCLAIAGYRMWGQMFDQFGVLPGLRAGIDVASYPYEPCSREPFTMLFLGSFRYQVDGPTNCVAILAGR